MMRSGVNHLRLLRLLVCSMIFATSAGMLVSLHFTAQAAGQTVQVWLTTTDGANHLTRQADLQFSTTSGTGSSPIIDVNDAQRLQQMDGFGAAVTDSSAWLLYNKMSTAQRNTVMTNLFGTNPNNPSSIGLSFVRIPMGASDFSVNGAYSYDDLPAGQTDPSLSHFSISHDTSYILPILQQAYQLNPAIRFMANPWSPPAWMKTNDSMIGTGNGSTGTLLPSYYSTLAQYFVKFIQAYQAAPYNIPIYAITPQNEPLYVPPDYPGMSWPASNESNFIKNNLAPALASANLHSKILGYDHDWSGSSYAQTLLSDPTTNNDLAGIAWHCYNGDPSAMTAIHNQYPTKEMYETECATGISITHISTINLLMQSVQNWARSVELWNIALDPNHGPHTGGCTDCNGVVTINQSTGNVTYSNDYYLLGQFSKFALPGAYHIASTVPSGTNVTDVAFQNPDGSKVVVANNGGNSSSTFTVRWDSTQSFSYTLPAGATVSFVWPGTSTTPTPTPKPTTPGITPTATPTSTPVPTNTPTPTSTPIPTVTPTSTPTPTITPTSTPTPTVTPTPTPKPTVTPIPTPKPTVTPTPTPKPTVTPTPTSMPISDGSCNVSYVVQNQWPTGFTGSITIENTNTTALNGWYLQFSFLDGQQVQQGWNGYWTQSGTDVTVTDASWNGTLEPDTPVTIGFNASLSGTNPDPTIFSLNSVMCNTV